METRSSVAEGRDSSPGAQEAQELPEWGKGYGATDRKDRRRPPGKTTSGSEM